MVWRNVQVARPSDSTSGGQCAARHASSSLFTVVDADAASAAAAAVEEAIACAAELLELLLLLFPRVVPVVVVVVVLPVVPVGGFQLRKEVQILQGLPSGPRTIPGGSERALEEKDEEVEVSVLLELVPIVAPLQSRTRNVV